VRLERWLSLRTMYEEIGLLWDQELKYRPTFQTANGVVTIPVLLEKVCGSLYAFNLAYCVTTETDVSYPVQTGNDLGYAVIYQTCVHTLIKIYGISAVNQAFKLGDAEWGS
ncbi:MAG: hypothetical protein HFG19_08200, partial [Oscillospiraceae bacterium]|nr:hypothetical protein [Oscillospiraceae bacterium]